MRKPILAAAVLVLAAAAWRGAGAHCQIPCGIYDDEARVALIAEDIRTIERAMEQINALAAAETPDLNQVTRWVLAKEEHATRIQETVAQYFMCQRLAPPADAAGPEREEYLEQLTLLHRLLRAAMRAKQTSDPATVEPLRDLLERFRAAYFHEHGE